MRRPSRPYRLFLALLAAVQVAAPAGAALADAVVHAPLLGQHGEQGQAPQHVCPFCQLLGQHAVAAAPALPVGPAAQVDYVDPSVPRAPVRETVLLLPDWRAPPLS